MRTIEQAYEDGYNCGKKGLGLTKSNRFDYAAQAKLFQRIELSIMSSERGEASESWSDGWFDGIYDRPKPNEQ